MGSHAWTKGTNIPLLWTVRASESPQPCLVEFLLWHWSWVLQKDAFDSRINTRRTASEFTGHSSLVVVAVVPVQDPRQLASTLALIRPLSRLLLLSPVALSPVVLSVCSYILKVPYCSERGSRSRTRFADGILKVVTPRTPFHESRLRVVRRSSTLKVVAWPIILRERVGS